MYESEAASRRGGLNFSYGGGSASASKAASPPNNNNNNSAVVGVNNPHFYASGPTTSLAAGAYSQQQQQHIIGNGIDRYPSAAVSGDSNVASGGGVSAGVGSGLNATGFSIDHNNTMTSLYPSNSGNNGSAILHHTTAAAMMDTVNNAPSSSSAAGVGGSGGNASLLSSAADNAASINNAFNSATASKQRVIVASQALEIQRLQDFCRQQEKEHGERIVTHVKHIDELEQKLHSVTIRNRQLEGDVQLLGGKLRTAESKLDIQLAEEKSSILGSITANKDKDDTILALKAEITRVRLDYKTIAEEKNVLLNKLLEERASYDAVKHTNRRLGEDNSELQAQIVELKRQVERFNRKIVLAANGQMQHRDDDQGRGEYPIYPHGSPAAVANIFAVSTSTQTTNEPIVPLAAFEVAQLRAFAGGGRGGGSSSAFDGGDGGGFDHFQAHKTLSDDLKYLLSVEKGRVEFYTDCVRDHQSNIAVLTETLKRHVQQQMARLADHQSQLQRMMSEVINEEDGVKGSMDGGRRPQLIENGGNQQKARALPSNSGGGAASKTNTMPANSKPSDNTSRLPSATEEAIVDPNGENNDDVTGDASAMNNNENENRRAENLREASAPPAGLNTTAIHSNAHTPSAARNATPSQPRASSPTTNNRTRINTNTQAAGFQKKISSSTTRLSSPQRGGAFTTNDNDDINQDDDVGMSPVGGGTRAVAMAVNSARAAATTSTPPPPNTNSTATATTMSSKYANVLARNSAKHENEMAALRDRLASLQHDHEVSISGAGGGGGSRRGSLMNYNRQQQQQQERVAPSNASASIHHVTPATSNASSSSRQQQQQSMRNPEDYFTNRHRSNNNEAARQQTPFGNSYGGGGYARSSQQRNDFNHNNGYGDEGEAVGNNDDDDGYDYYGTGSRPSGTQQHYDPREEPPTAYVHTASVNNDDYGRNNTEDGGWRGGGGGGRGYRDSSGGRWEEEGDDHYYGGGRASQQQRGGDDSQHEMGSILKRMVNNSGRRSNLL